MSDPAKKFNQTPEGYQPKDRPEIVKLAQAQQPTKKHIPLKNRLSEIALVDLPKTMVASHEVISAEPEQEGAAFMEAWVQKALDLPAPYAPMRSGEHGIRSFGFDCHKGKDIPKGCRIYHWYVTLPKGADVAGDDEVEIKEFPGGQFARIVVENPFMDCDFPCAWGKLLKWVFKNKIPNRLGCKSKKDCYSLYSNEESPCLEETYEENGVQYMAMYLPVERPEGYQPKDMPEIMKLAGKAAGRTYAVLSANGGSYIDGAPVLEWGKWRDNTYCGCIAAVMEILGGPVSYETLMGVSGLCYRIGLKVSLDPSSEIPQNGDVWDDQICAAIGYKMGVHVNENGRRKRVRENLNAGRPVLGMGLFADPEWEILTGYDKKSFFGRSYFHTQTPLSRRQLPDMPGGYLRAKNYPGVHPKGFLRFFDEPCEKAAPPALLKKSLEICLAYWSHEPRADNRFGEAAYRLLIENLEKSDEIWAENSGCANYHIGCLADARRSAYIYLRDSAPLLHDHNRKKLLEIAGAYRSIADDILAVTPYEMLNVAWAQGGAAPGAWSGEIRRALAAALERAIETEKRIQLTVKDILANWEETV